MADTRPIVKNLFYNDQRVLQLRTYMSILKFICILFSTQIMVLFYIYFFNCDCISSFDMSLFR